MDYWNADLRESVRAMIPEVEGRPCVNVGGYEGGIRLSADHRPRHRRGLPERDLRVGGAGRRPAGRTDRRDGDQLRLRPARPRLVAGHVLRVVFRVRPVPRGPVPRRGSLVGGIVPRLGAATLRLTRRVPCQGPHAGRRGGPAAHIPEQLDLDVGPEVARPPRVCRVVPYEARVLTRLPHERERFAPPAIGSDRRDASRHDRRRAVGVKCTGATVAPAGGEPPGDVRDHLHPGGGKQKTARAGAAPTARASREHNRGDDDEGEREGSGGRAAAGLAGGGAGAAAPGRRRCRYRLRSGPPRRPRGRARAATRPASGSGPTCPSGSTTDPLSSSFGRS